MYGKDKLVMFKKVPFKIYLIPSVFYILTYKDKVTCGDRFPNDSCGRRL